MLELKDVRFSVTDEKGQLKNIINGINLKIDEGKFCCNNRTKRFR